MMAPQRGGFVLGMVVGLLVGLALALGVALYITKAPVPFINKVPQRTTEQDTAETERNRNWDPNAPLAGKAGTRPVQPAAVPAPSGLPPGIATAPATTPATAPLMATAASRPASAALRATRDPAAILSGSASTAPGPEAFMYFVQVGAYTRPEEAEQQRARLGLIGYTARVTEREQSGRTVFRVRLGPYDSREDADIAQTRLADASIEARLVRVERQ